MDTYVPEELAAVLPKLARALETAGFAVDFSLLDHDFMKSYLGAKIGPIRVLLIGQRARVYADYVLADAAGPSAIELEFRDCRIAAADCLVAALTSELAGAHQISVIVPNGGERVAA